MIKLKRIILCMLLINQIVVSRPITSIVGKALSGPHRSLNMSCGQVLRSYPASREASVLRDLEKKGYYVDYTRSIMSVMSSYRKLKNKK